MSQRNKQHMGRSADDDRELLGRDVRAGDETADQADKNAMPMPNEEGTNFRPDRQTDTGVDAPRGPDAEPNEDSSRGERGGRESGG